MGAIAGQRVPIQPGTDAITSTPKTSTPAVRSARHAAAVVAPVVSTSSITTTGRRRRCGPAQPREPGRRGWPPARRRPGPPSPGRAGRDQARRDAGRVAALRGEPGRGAGHRGDRVAAPGPGGRSPARRGHQPDRFGQQARPMQPQQAVAERRAEHRGQIAPAAFLAGDDRRPHRVGVPGQCPGRWQRSGGATGDQLGQPDPPRPTQQRRVTPVAPGARSTASGTRARQHQVHRRRDTKPPGMQIEERRHSRPCAPLARRGGARPEMWTT